MVNRPSDSVLVPWSTICVTLPPRSLQLVLVLLPRVLLLRRTCKIRDIADLHDVDEDARTVVLCGGSWLDSIDAGVAFRVIGHYSFSPLEYVASSNIKN